MKRRIEEMSMDLLAARKSDLIDIIETCSYYLKSCPNTILGPLGAKAEIKRCRKELKLIDLEIESRELSI